MRKNSSKERILSKLTRPMTVKELARETFMDAHHLGKMLRRFRKEREVYICEWEQEDYPRALWMAGNSRDKPRPKAKTRAQVSEAYRARINQNPERRALYLAKKRVARMEVRPDIASTWIR